MPLIFQKIYRRDDARRNPDVFYVFGDNVRRKGMGGQAAEMRHEPNAVGVATKYSPYDCFGEEAAQIIAQKRIIDIDMKPLFEALKAGKVVVWPADGIGTGLARLREAAPSTLEYLEFKLAALIRVGKLFDHGNTMGAAEEADAHIDDSELDATVRISPSDSPSGPDPGCEPVGPDDDRTVRIRRGPKRPELDALLKNAKPPTEADLDEQRKSWARQDKD